MPSQQRQPRSASPRTQRERRRGWLIVTGVIAFLALFTWPLEALLVGILAGTLVVLHEAFLAWMQARSIAEYERLAERSAIAGSSIVVLGAVTAAIWPVPMAILTLVLALVACGLNVYLRTVLTTPATPPASETLATSVADTTSASDPRSSERAEAPAEPVPSADASHATAPPPRRTARSGSPRRGSAPKSSAPKSSAPKSARAAAKRTRPATGRARQAH